MALRSNSNADILDGFSFHSEAQTLPDGRVKATTTLGGKRFEAFDADLKWANEKLKEQVTAAVQSGDVTLNEI